MNGMRWTTRILAGLAATGILAVGAVAPAQADTGWNRMMNNSPASTSTGSGR